MTANISFDPYVTTAQWSRRFLGLRLFLSLAAAGWQGYGEHVERSIALMIYTLVTAIGTLASLLAIAAFGSLALHGSLAEGIRLAMLVAAGLALAGAACAALTMRAGGAPDR